MTASNFGATPAGGVYEGEPHKRQRKERYRPGSTWRFLAHEWKGYKAMNGKPIELRSQDCPPSEFDELVVDHWFHMEQLDANLWWMQIGDYTVHVYVDREGKAEHVEIEEPSHV
jgi:DNA polymerase IIIc chi subunit